jgi:hypothetical protein
MRPFQREALRQIAQSLHAYAVDLLNSRLEEAVQIVREVANNPTQSSATEAPSPMYLNGWGQWKSRESSAEAERLDNLEQWREDVNWRLHQLETPTSPPSKLLPCPHCGELLSIWATHVTLRTTEAAPPGETASTTTEGG